MRTMTGKPTIFILDDDKAVRDSLQILLESSGLSVETYESGPAFLDTLDLRREGCLLLDLRMPGMSGLEVQEALAAKGSTLPIIMVTGHGDIPMAVRAIKAGAADFIEKPFREEIILDSVWLAIEPRQQTRAKAFPVDDIRGRIAILTRREREVLDQLIIGQPNKVVAFHLGISPRTVEIYRARVLEKMQANSLPHLVRMTLAVGLEPEMP